MIEKRTLFVLGAGSSAGYGLPLGTELLDRVIHTLKTRNSLKIGATSEVAPIRALGRRLERSRCPTIDSFLRHVHNRDDYLAAIGDVIWKDETEAITNHGIAKNSNEDWISWLYHNRLHQNPSQFAKNPVAFISFNYDRLPQALMATMMRNIFSCSPKEAVDAVTSKVDQLDRFHHIHGSLDLHLVKLGGTDEYDLGVVGSPYEANFPDDRFAANLQTMYDPNDQATKLKEYFKWAECVIFLGLGFHQEMLDLFMEAEAPIHGHRRMGTAVGISEQLRDQIERSFRDIFLAGDKTTCKALLVNQL
ncbi:MAG: hypothetical protein AAGI53_02535 [Planctomycetota bacterium]